MDTLAKLVSTVSRRTLRTEGHVFAVTPERVALAEGLRAALAMAPMLLAASLLAHPELALGAIAAFWNCLCDPQGSRAARLRTLCNFTLLGVVALPLAAYVAHWGNIAGLVILFVLVLLCGLTRSYAPSLGPMPAQAGLIASLAVVIGVASARPLEGALALGGYFLLGSGWAILFCIWLWPIPFRQSGNLTLSTLFDRLEFMTAFLESLDQADPPTPDGWDTFDTVHRRGLRMSLERARALAALDSCNGARMSAGIDSAGRVLSALIAIGHARRQSPLPLDAVARAHLHALRRLMAAISAVRLQDQALPPALQRQIDTLLEETAGVPGTTARAVRFAAQAVARLAQLPRDMPTANMANAVQPAIPAPSITTTSRLTIAPMVWRHALRVATAGTVALAIGTWLNLALAYWGALAAIIVTQPVSANTWLRVLERACGSIIGGLAAAALLAALDNHPAVALLILPLAAAAIAARLVNYGLFVVFLCPMFMLVSDFIHPAQGMMAARLLNEVMGAVVGVAASFLLWPEPNEDALSASLAAAVSTNLRFASAVLRLDAAAAAELDSLQRQAGMTSARLEATRERMLLEGRWRSPRLQALRDVITALRLVCGAAAVTEVLRQGKPDQRSLQRAAACDAFGAALLQALASGGPVPRPDHVSDTGQPADDLGQALPGLADALAAYVALTANKTA